MIRFETYGFADMGRMLDDAYRGGYAVPALNFITMEQLNAIGDAAIRKDSPVILMVAPKHCRQFEIKMLVRMAQAMVERLRDAGCGSAVAMHLDHGRSFEDCKLAIDHGFSSVMIDGSELDLDGNIALTRRVVEYARPFGVAVEGEVGALSGAEDRDEAGAERSRFTDPADAERFMRESGAGCLAVSVGTMHGLKKTETRCEDHFAGLRYDLIGEIGRRLPGVPLVLHGCSELPDKYTDMINRYSGRVEKTLGIPDEYLERARGTAVCKINIASDGWIPSMAITRKVLSEHPREIDSRLYTQAVREELISVYEHKMDLFGSTGKNAGCHAQIG